MTGVTGEGRPRAIRETDDSSSQGANLGLDEIHHLLQNQRRRRALSRLRARDGAVRIGDLAEEIAAAENDVTVEQLSSDQRKRVYIALHQLHLPTLSDAGVVEYDSDRGTVRERAAADQLYAMLDASEQIRAGASRQLQVGTDAGAANDAAWHRGYVGATIGGYFLLAAAVLGGPVPEPYVAVVVVTAFAALTVARTLVKHRQEL